ncbi:hypothetical protein LAZ40_09600 [Cereibacter sphaeroides]|uniref:hypothetical protein n=1 Tax=Cereibacter sphaeroides TaxID=1063 RepID=UPI001F31A312|nr:hypothetical protein [Cereibacter sphaeroides]MCE6959304.1 hypothetical protein [Cereibacter sphaeroides]MCE6972896.1 hypothetical protein [Cereibacter sphaeroides]
MNRLASDWKIGIELEVVLGDPGTGRLGPVDLELADEASIRYCREVARVLGAATGRRWVASAKSGARPDFRVMPEYDIDPINFMDGGLIAGVELVTPPMALSELEELRDPLLDAILNMGGHENFESSLFQSNLGWHVNVDRGANTLDYLSLARRVPEFSFLKGQGRDNNSLCSPIRHSYLLESLAELRTGTRELITARRLNDLQEQLFFEKSSKSYAVNVRDRYAELRYFSTRSFDFGMPLDRVLAPILVPLQGAPEDRTVIGGYWKRKDAESDLELRRCALLRDWLDALPVRIEPSTDEKTLQLLISGELAGHVSLGGCASVTLMAAGGHIPAAQVHRGLLSLVPEAVATAALDIAEARDFGFKMALQSPKLSEAVDDLRRQLADQGLALAPETDDWIVYGEFFDVEDAEEDADDEPAFTW